MYLHLKNQSQTPLPARPAPAALPGAPAGEAAQRVQAWLRAEAARKQVDRAEGQALTVREWGGGVFRYRYDSRGDLVEIIEADGSRRAYQYDELRRLSEVAHPDGSLTHYTYTAEGRLGEIADRGSLTHFRHDRQGRVRQIEKSDESGQTCASRYRYDALGRVISAAAGRVRTSWQYDAQGRVTRIRQTLDGRHAICLRLEYDADNRLSALYLPGLREPVRYAYNERGRPACLQLGESCLAQYEYDDARRVTRARLANGVESEQRATLSDGRLLSLTLRRGDEILLERAIHYGPLGEITQAGRRQYAYDPLGRLVSASDGGNGPAWAYNYDALDRRSLQRQDGQETRCLYDEYSRLQACEDGSGQRVHYTEDHHGCRVVRAGADGDWQYRYDAGGRLSEVLRNGHTAARLTYDHKGRLVLAESPERSELSERYLYGPGDELFAVITPGGAPLRLLVRLPWGVPVELHGAQGRAFFRHEDDQGTVHCWTDDQGRVAARAEFCPYGSPLINHTMDEARLPVIFGGHTWHPEVGLYDCGARWYDPLTGQFLTPDSYTGAPDDERLVHPHTLASGQADARAQYLEEWLLHPRIRGGLAFCANDPVNAADPTGHWSVGGMLLSLLGALWTLPNTLLGLLIEITCLLGEVVRWIAGLGLEPVGFDAASSSRLNAFALVFKGGWLGSIPSLLGITFGNIFFTYGQMQTSAYVTGLSDPFYPAAYEGKVSIPRSQVIYEHELRHTNQYGWFGPFFLLGLPLWGVYVWDAIFHGYQNAWLERDARHHGDEAYVAPAPPPAGSARPIPPAVAPAEPPAAPESVPETAPVTDSVSFDLAAPSQPATLAAPTAAAESAAAAGSAWAATGSTILRVMDEYGLPAQGSVALVSESGAFFVDLDENGMGQVDDLPEGQYWVEMEGSRVRVEGFDYTQSAQLGGSVQLDSGSLPVTIALYRPGDDRPMAQTSTDAQGNYIFWNVPAGEYRVVINDYQIRKTEGTP